MKRLCPRCRFPLRPCLLGDPDLHCDRCLTVVPLLKPHTMIVHFDSVGRFRRCWTASLPADGDPAETIHREVTRKKVQGVAVLMSRDVVVDFEDDAGVVFAGTNLVGRFRIEWLFVGTGARQEPA